MKKAQLKGKPSSKKAESGPIRLQKQYAMGKGPTVGSGSKKKAQKGKY